MVCDYWCMCEKLIASRYECSKYGKDMVLRERKSTTDGYEWRCRTKEGENLHDVCKSSMNEFFVKVNKNTVVDWYMFCQEVCVVVNESEQLGGEEKIVEIDESLFGKMKYGRGKPKNGQWVFGGVERNSINVFLKWLQIERKNF
ncbi:DDE_Tnp_IS1595 domain-containing protein [Trichonephila clavipes]|nr:DDE_Tnp_IS1595 domain-containing protein [Trichonephila clavipes]